MVLLLPHVSKQGRRQLTQDIRWRDRVCGVVDLITVFVSLRRVAVVAASCQTHLAHSFSKVREGLVTTRNKSVIVVAVCNCS
jgi:hypothetical protein